MTQPTSKPTLPALALDYSTGMFTNTLTGETGPDVTGVVLAYRTDRILWPSPQNPDPRPECENGTVYGPCDDCQFAAFGPHGEPPVCSEELTLLLWQDDGAQVVTVTGRRSYLKPLEQFLDMKALVTGTLHDQRVTIRMTPGPDLHRLTLLPGDMLDPESVGRMAGVAERVQRSGAWEGL